MKKVFFMMVTALTLFAVPSNAQKGGQFREAMKQRLKDSLQLTDTQADSVSSIMQQYQPKMKEIYTNQSLDKDAKKSQLAAVIAERKTKLQAILSEEQITKLEAMEQNMRSRMRQRMTNKSSGD